MSSAPRMTAAVTCSDCGQKVPDDAPDGRCPGCLFWLALSRCRPGATLGPYELLETLGEGSMGVVYRARHLTTGRVDALKTIRSGQFAGPGEVRRFQTEARAASTLNHPHTVRIYEVGEDAGRHYFSMELIEGGTLADLGPIEARRAARYAKQIAEAMQALHERNVFHRDLKPSNVLLDGEDRARITDFGLAKLRSADPSLTGTGQVLGTPSYMAPEQAVGQTAGAAGDIYSIGAILYELLTGRPPFRGGTAIETLKQLLEEEPVSPRVRVPTVPRKLELICLRCLAREPRLRPESSGALAEELERYLTGKRIRTQPLRNPARWMRRHGPVLAAFAVLAGLGWAAREQQLASNLYSARHAASSILLEFRDWSVPLIAAAESDELRNVLRDRDPHAAAEVLASLRSHTPRVQSLLLMDPDCRALARNPVETSFIGADVSHRDYCSGALSSTGSFYVSKVHYSQFDQLLRHALSVQVRAAGTPRHDADGGGELLGVLAGSLAAEAYDDKMVMVAPWDSTPREGDVEIFPPGTKWVVVLHPGYRHADPQAVAFEGIPEEGARLYFDPMGRREWRWRGPWLAGIAPVGATGYVVVVQTRDGVGLGLGLLAFALAGYAAWAMRRARAV